MPIVDSIPAWLSVSPHEAAATSATDSSASTCAAESAPESTPSSSPSSSSPPHSPLATPHSPQFPDCEALSDTLLTKIAAGTECLASIASYHHIPFPRFTLWLLEPSTQARLAALSVAIASAARLTATAALPDIVRGLKTTVDQLQHPSHPTIAAPGPNALRAESLILRRHRALIAAASLIYRISRFTCPGQHPPTPRHEPPPRARTHTPTSRDNSAPPRRGLAPLPKLDLPALDFAYLDPRPARDSEPVRAAASATLPSTSPKGEVPAQPGVGAPAFPTDSPRLSSPTSDIPHPTSHIEPPTSAIDNALRILTAEYDLSAEEIAELRADAHSWIRDFIPPPAAAKSATRRARRSRADDG